MTLLNKQYTAAHQGRSKILPFLNFFFTKGLLMELIMGFDQTSFLILTIVIKKLDYKAVEMKRLNLT